MKKATFIVMLLLLFSCSASNKEDYFDLRTLNNISRLSSMEPPPASISHPPVYVIGTDDSIAETSFMKLRAVYEASYCNEYSQFSVFLYEALNHKIKVDTRTLKNSIYFSRFFMVEPTIDTIYKKDGVDVLLRTYCSGKGGWYRLNKNALTMGEINSISYLLFLNQYVRFDDDYESAIDFKKINVNND